MKRPLAVRALRAYVRHVPAGPGTTWLAGHLSGQLKEHPLTAITRTRSGAVFPVVTSDVIQRYLYLFGVWEPHLTTFIADRLNPGDMETHSSTSERTSATTVCSPPISSAPPAAWRP